jgi:hypothetical protein
MSDDKATIDRQATQIAMLSERLQGFVNYALDVNDDSMELMKAQEALTATAADVQAYEREVREVCAAICKGRQAGREIGSGEWLEAEKCASTILDDAVFNRIRAIKATHDKTTYFAWQAWQAAQQKLETQEPLKLIAPIAYELKVDGVDFSKDFINGADGIYRSRDMAVNRADAIRSARGEDWKNNITIHPVYSTPLAPIEPCCGDYFNCQRPCTPRGRELEKREHTTPPAEPTPETGLAIIEAMHAQGFHDANAEDALFVYRAVIGSAK